MALRALAVCAGVGGLELGLRLAVPGARCVGYVEREAFAAATLVARMEDEALDRAPVWDDIETFNGTAWRGAVDIVLAGFPCQPWSDAGSRRGTEDERWIWPAIARCIRDVRPRLVFLENVPPLATRGGLGHVLASLAEEGFNAEWDMLSASEVGAPHRRKRLFILAHSRRSDGERWGEPGVLDGAAGAEHRQARQRERDGDAPLDGGSPVVHPGHATGRSRAEARGDSNRDHARRDQASNGPGEPGQGLADAKSEPWGGHEGPRRPRGGAADARRSGPAVGVSNGSRRSPSGRGLAFNDGGEPQQASVGVGLAHPDGEGRQGCGPAESRGWPLPGERGPGMADPAVGGQRTSIRLDDGREPDARWSLPLFPPGPADFDAWARVLAVVPEVEPAVCRLANGAASGVVRSGMDTRTDQLRALGNAVVPLQAATAFIELGERLMLSLITEKV